MKTRLMAASVAAATGLSFVTSPAAHAGPEVIFDFAYNTLAGSYDAGTGDFSAVAADSGNLVTSGNVRRLVDGPDSATFSAGFKSLGTAADIIIDMDLVAAEGDELRFDATGTMRLIDADGDEIQATIVGQWIENGIGQFFNGSLLDVMLVDNGADDAFFNGTMAGTGFHYGSALGDDSLEGAIVLLQLADRTVTFEDSFQGAATDVAGQIIPAPGTLALAGIGLGLFAGSGRRRRG